MNRSTSSFTEFMHIAMKRLSSPIAKIKPQLRNAPMPYRHLIPLVLAAAFACAPSAYAQKSACDVLTDAAVKQIMTPHHATMTTTRNEKATRSEYITTASTRYLFVNGKWTSHPVDVKQEADETAAAMKARSQTCTRLGEETLAG